MQTTVELTEEQARRLDELSALEKISPEEVLSKAVDKYLSKYEQASGKRKGPGDWPELDAVFGIWKDRGEDALDYQRRIRGE